MNPRERVYAGLQHQAPDCVPRLEIWIDALLGQPGEEGPASVYPHLSQDCVMMPARNPPESCAWRTGVDEWGRIWRDGVYVDGVVDSEVDRCIAQGAPGGGYMLAACNSSFEGMNPRAVAEFFRYEEQVGFY